MSLSKRLDRLESEIGGRGCSECGAGGPGPVRFRMQEHGDPQPEPCGTCGTCGAEPYVFTLRLDNPNEAGAERPDTA